MLQLLTLLTRKPCPQDKESNYKTARERKFQRLDGTAASPTRFINFWNMHIPKTWIMSSRGAPMEAALEYTWRRSSFKRYRHISFPIIRPSVPLKDCFVCGVTAASRHHHDKSYIFINTFNEGNRSFVENSFGSKIKEPKNKYHPSREAFVSTMKFRLGCRFTNKQL
jgi:hypothetical protein